MLALPANKSKFKQSKHLFVLTLSTNRIATNQNNSTTTDVVSQVVNGLANASLNSTRSNSEPQDSSVNLATTEIKDFQTTKFIDDADIVQRDETNIDYMDPTFLNQNDTQMTEQTLIDFLRKPIVIAQNNFSTTDTYSFFNSYSMPYFAMNTANGALWVNKLTGYFGIRFDMRFRIVVNANRFQQGRYILGWVPMGGCAPSTSNLRQLLFNNMHMATLVQRTTVPHVEIDLATQTSAELLIPFASTQLFWPINSILSHSDVSCLGYINLYPYSPLVTPSGSTVASYSLYLSLENVQLFGAAAPQSSKQNREISNKQNGPISGAALSISRGFKEFADIPLISTYALGASWIADRISKVASIFGFSKPTQGDSHTKFILQNLPSHSTIDGDSEVKTLSFLSKPGTVPIKGHSTTNFDEMDFSYIVRKYAYFNQFQWSTASAVGSTLSNVNVSPNQYINNASVYSFTPCSFVMQFFNFWRGSLKFRIKIVKTEFHSGRLQVCFYPQDEILYNTASYYVNRQIIDIRDVIEFEVIVPYISRSPWTNVTKGIGQLRFEVVDPLVAPASVSSSITFLVETCGGDDIEFAVPAVVNFSPIAAVPQSSSQEGTSKNLSFTIGNSSIFCNPVNASAYCIGDKITSFRSLLKRFSPLPPSAKTVASAAYRALGPNVGIATDCINILGSGTATYYTTPDLTSIVASCYIFWSGGVRIRDVYSMQQNAGTATNVINPGQLLTGSFTYNNSTLSNNIFTLVTVRYLDSNLPLALNSSWINNSLTVEVPQYTPNLSRNILDCTLWQQDAPTSYQIYQPTASNTTYNLVISGSAALGAGKSSVLDFDTHNIFRALADDGNFSLFISVPPVVVINTSATSGFY